MRFTQGMKLKPGEILSCNPDGTPYHLYVLEVIGDRVTYSLHNVNKQVSRLRDETFHGWYYIKRYPQTYKQAITQAFS